MSNRKKRKERRDFMKRMEHREQLIFGRSFDPANYARNELAYFEGISVDTAKQLQAEGLLDPDRHPELAPSAREMIAFACAGEDEEIWFFHGFTVSPSRPDCRVTFEGMGSYVLPSPPRLAEFLRLHSKADELLVEEEGYGCYCWYD